MSSFTENKGREFLWQRPHAAASTSLHLRNKTSTMCRIVQCFTGNLKGIDTRLRAMKSRLRGCLPRKTNPSHWNSKQILEIGSTTLDHHRKCKRDGESWRKDKTASSSSSSSFLWKSQGGYRQRFLSETLFSLPDFLFFLGGIISHFTDASNGRWLEFHWCLKVGGSLLLTHMAKNLLDCQPTLLRPLWTAARGGSVYWSLSDKRPRCHSLYFTATSRLITSSPLLNHFSLCILVSVFGWHGNSDHTGLRKKRMWWEQRD